MTLADVSLIGLLAAAGLVSVIVFQLVAIGRKIGKLADIEIYKAFSTRGYKVVRRSGFALPSGFGGGSATYKITFRQRDDRERLVKLKVQFTPGVWGLGARITKQEWEPPLVAFDRSPAEGHVGR